ncbi:MULTISPECIES: PRC-barrel domain-containing protein [unclassified Dinoroseobacter]|uniref:PRC-barrel domain-containing protein n=1 Tax=unclassified Dinoroseobacter TaxID=2620028 RepID=UPI003C7B7066
MTVKHLLSTAAAAALMTTAAFAEMDKETEATTYDAAKAEVEAGVAEMKSDAEDMAEATGDAISEGAAEAEDMAEKAGDAISEGASDVATATSEAAEDAEAAVTEMANDAENAMESTETEIETTASDMANDVETEVETATAPTMVTEPNDWDLNWGDDAGTLTVADIIGMNVVNEDGDVIGEIDYVVGSESKPMGIIGIGGFLGLGEYTVSVPLEEFSMKDDETLMLAGATEEALKTRPEYDESEAENISNDIPLGDLLTGAYFTSAS